MFNTFDRGLRDRFKKILSQEDSMTNRLLMINHMNTMRLRESLPIQVLQIYSNSEQLLTHRLICKNSCRYTCEIYIYLMMREGLRELFVENGPCTMLDVEYCVYCEYDSRK